MKSKMSRRTRKNKNPGPKIMFKCDSTFFYTPFKNEILMSEVSPDLFSIDNPNFSNLLKEMITSALKNGNKPPQARRYSEVLLDFSMYMFMLSGRALYETLSENLPIPKSSTIRRYP